MTLVQSLLQLLSGNRIVLVLLAFTFFVSSCGIRSQRTAEVVPVVIPKDQQEKPKETETEKEVEQAEEIEKPVETYPDEIVIKKDFHEIAVLLPFELDAAPVNLNYALSEENPFKSSTRMAVEFYQGLTLALDKLEDTKFQANVHIIDTKNNESSTKILLQKSPFPKVDLIVGPIFNKQLRKVADYCKQKEIPMVSPLSSSTSITSNNPFYYSANATPEVHYDVLYDHMEKDFDSRNLYIFYQNTASDKKVVDYFEALNTKKDTSEQFRITSYEMATDQKSHDLKVMLDSTETSLVLVPSYNEAFVEYSLNQLAQIIHHYPSVVFGMPKWSEFRNVNFDYLEWMNVQITASYYSDKRSGAYTAFINKFQSTYGYPPSNYSIQAYDLMLFLSKNLSGKYKKGEMLLRNSDFNGIQTNFDFGPILNEEEDIDYIANKYVHLLEFKDFEFKRIK